MSALVGDGSPLTANGVVDGTQRGKYVLPLLGTFRVESVVAQVDATAAAGVTPTLRVLDKSGAVIATKRQGSSIPAGDTGSATWALRLADDGGGGGIEFDKDNEGGYLDVTINAADPAGNSGKMQTTVDGDFLLGWDAGGVPAENVAGDVIIGVPYNGNRAVRFRQSHDSAPAFTESMVIDDFSLDVKCGNVKSLRVLTDTGIDFASIALELAVRLRAGSRFTIYNSAGQAIFRVDSDGSLHGRTGKALTFDL